jgi:RimJ/RimL family protein N-acetyltransferase
MYKNENYSFRIIEQFDIEWIRLMHNDPEVLYMLTDANPISYFQQIDWYENISRSTKSKRLVFEYQGKAIGLARLDEIDLINKSICVGLDIHSDFRYKGHGKAGLKLLLMYCFEELNMNRAWLLVAEFNLIAFELYKKLGFIYEGIQRQRLFRKGKYFDYIMMSILKNEYDSTI